MREDVYRFSTTALRSTGKMQMLKGAIGILCIAMTGAGLVMQFHPLGPHGLIPRLVQFGLSASATVVGLMWIFLPWPSFRWAVAFAIWGDAALAVATAMNSAPESRLTGTVDLVLIGIFVAGLLGPRALAAHCVFATEVCFGIAAYSVAFDDVGWFDLYIYLAPALLSVVLLPVAIQAVIEGVRRNMQLTIQDAVRDPLTALHNRRGMYRATDELIKGRTSGALVAIVIDLDRFKRVNDRGGHGHGDLALKEVADVLTSCIRAHDIAARLGGDEFVIVAAVNSDNALAGLVDRVHGRLQDISSTVTASVGVACEQLPLANEDGVDGLLRHADRAMYEAKRLGGSRLMHADPDLASEGAAERGAG